MLALSPRLDPRYGAEAHIDMRCSNVVTACTGRAVRSYGLSWVKLSTLVFRTR